MVASSQFGYEDTEQEGRRGDSDDAKTTIRQIPSPGHLSGYRLMVIVQEVKSAFLHAFQGIYMYASPYPSSFVTGSYMGYGIK